MTVKKKLLGEDRRAKLLHILKTSEKPVTGTELARIAHVSRQVIVGDITLLKAKQEPIVATAQGYMYFANPPLQQSFEKIVACLHGPTRTEEELNLLVDFGITVKDVTIEHPVYGDLTASIMVSSRKEVQQFLEKIAETKAAFLSELTEGIHLHTLIALSEELLEEAEEALRKANLLVE
ncbi:transcription repressor NadR [Peribacillus cavernae]|uniref:Transcription repressor NadR n=1 Tax=Peribacillus cavernae TaxID=1674310 RepID=A0A3S1B3J1_9BACI|nr:transcription repressor NadR [Peribacillus cavernae]MDQ0219357.1 transcriptional regulator of NAD metabolism [Peribacillus cavernae]RUQ27766.1 transcription repressor NadR [Peribacillus cavernae]